MLKAELTAVSRNETPNQNQLLFALSEYMEKEEYLSFLDDLFFYYIASEDFATSYPRQRETAVFAYQRMREFFQQLPFPEVEEGVIHE